MKILLISSGVVSLAVAMKLAMPVVINFTVYELPTLYSVFLALFKPPYLYVIINGIIITIAVSTRFTPNDSSPSNNDLSHPLVSAITPLPIEFSDALTVAAPMLEGVPPTDVAVVHEEEVLELKQPVVVNGLEAVHNEALAVENKEEVINSMSTYTPLQNIISRETEIGTLTETDPVTERPLVMSRFGHRRPLKASPEGGKVLRVARQRRQETLESTWRMITEGRHVPLTRHMKKSDTLENDGRREGDIAADENCSSPQNRRVQKLRDSNNYYRDSPARSLKIRKEPSLSQDELNRRVEAFIKKFNEEMRLQREESLKQYMEMINRGT